MQIAWFAASKLSEFLPKRGERMRKAAAFCLGAGTAQDGSFQGRHRARVRALPGAKPRQRVLEQCEERNRGKTSERRLGREARESPCRRVRERITAGIVGRDVPAFQRGEHAPRQFTVGRDQCRGLACRLDRFA